MLTKLLNQRRWVKKVCHHAHFVLTIFCSAFEKSLRARLLKVWSMVNVSTTSAQVTLILSSVNFMGSLKWYADFFPFSIPY